MSYGPTLNLALNDAANLGWKLAAAVHGWAPHGLLDSYTTERHANGERVVMATKAETALEAPGPHVMALRQLFGELVRQPDVSRAIAATLSGADVRYDMGGGDAATGWFVPAIDVIVDGTRHRLAELLRDAKPLLLDATGGSLAAFANERVKHVVATAETSMLIRPDGYVAWSGTDVEQLRAALARWFG